MPRQRIRKIYRTNRDPPIYMVVIVDLDTVGMTSHFGLVQHGVQYMFEVCAPGWRALAGLPPLDENPLEALIEAIEG